MKTLKLLLVTICLIFLTGRIYCNAQNDIQTSKFTNPRFVTIEYRITTVIGSLPEFEELRTVNRVLVSENEIIPLIGAAKAIMLEGNMMAIYEFKCKNKPITQIYDIWIDGKKIESETRENCDIIADKRTNVL